ncbi:hypothetical protein E1B28_011520 [Marasmius oreades]|uniref:Zn(2)-C6 fungal-type domain-containing protein n=1 Tax=Marasmius oreades TaxID=181124 RepID=A0A9P7RVC6_9AGAR|nr:uncharacterized protein E1B28_011520 [Marasmius oreades]KAG7089886.1 hypothetical protein E1B28_011520 [Marasmius oreades]
MPTSGPGPASSEDNLNQSHSSIRSPSNSTTSTSTATPTTAPTPTVSLKRKRITLACHRCRQKKGKCDGKKPVCSTCESAASPCEWPDPDLDGRKNKKTSNVSKARKQTSGGAGGSGDLNQKVPESPFLMLVDDDYDHQHHFKRARKNQKEPYSGPGEESPTPSSPMNGQGHQRSLNGPDLYGPRNPRHLRHFDPVTERTNTVSPPSFTHSSSSSSITRPPLLDSQHGHTQSPLDVLLAAALPGSQPQWGGTTSRIQNTAREPLSVQDPGTVATAAQDLCYQSSRPLGTNLNASAANEPPLVLHYNRPFGPTAIQPGFERISIAFRAPIPGSRCPSPVLGESSSSPSPSSFPDVFSSNLGNTSFSFEPIHYTNSDTFIPDPNASTPTVTSSDSPYDPLSDIPKPIVLQKLLPLFFSKMGSHFPFITEESLLSNIDHEDPGRRVTAPLIINAVCALGARFSDIPITRTQARDTSQSPATYGIPFAEKMKQLLVPLLGFPTSNTVAALLFLAYFSFGLNNEGALWAYSGMALRMAVDLGLHQDIASSPYSSAASQNDIRGASDRLLWWSCFILDRMLAFGTGRPVTVKDREIKASLPVEEEILLVQSSPSCLSSGCGSNRGGHGGPGVAPSPFPYHVKMFQLYGALAETINVVEPSWKPESDQPPSRGEKQQQEELEGPKGSTSTSQSRSASVGAADETNLAEVEDMITLAYNSLPDLMVFNADNLRIHAKNSSSPTFLALHLWYNAIIIMLYRPPLIHPRVNASRSSLQDRLAVVNNSCLAISNILNSADLVDSFAYLASPFVNQCFFVAASAWIQDHRIRTGRDILASSTTNTTNGASFTSDMNTNTNNKHPSILLGLPSTGSSSTTSILSQTALTNFKLCKKALSRQGSYWMGVGWIRAVVERYASHRKRVGLVKATEGVETFVSHQEMEIFRRLVKRTMGESPGEGEVIELEALAAMLGQGQAPLSEDDWALAYSFASFTATGGGNGAGGYTDPFS